MPRLKWLTCAKCSTQDKSHKWDGKFVEDEARDNPLMDH